MKRLPILPILFALLAAPAVFAADLSLSLVADAEYDDNVFRSEENTEDDFLFRIRPAARIHEDRGDDLNFSIRYDLPIEFSAENNDELNDVDHVVGGDFTYHVNDRIDIFGNDQFRYLRSTVRQREFDSDSVSAGVGVPDINDTNEDRDRVTLNNGALGVSYTFAPRLLARVRGEGDYFDSSRPDRAENYSASGVVDVFYALTSKHQIGGGARYTFQEFDERRSSNSQVIEGSQTNTYNIFANWRYLFDETTSFEITLGPTYIETEQDDSAAATAFAPIPFQKLAGGATNSVFFNETGGQIPVGTNVAQGSLLVANANRCGTVGGSPVFDLCNDDTIVDPGSAAFAAIQAANDGPAVTVTNANPAGSDDSQFTYFGEAVATKRWTPNLATALRYSRSQGNASGLGGTVVTDAVSLSNTWDFTERWQIALRGDFTRRESVQDLSQTQVVVASQGAGAPGLAGTVVAGFTGNSFNVNNSQSKIDTNRWGVAGRVTHRLFKHTDLYVQLGYNRQDSSGGLGAASDFDNFLASFGVRHSFEPIKLW